MYKFGNAKKTARFNRKVLAGAFSIFGIFAMLAIVCGTALDVPEVSALGFTAIAPLGFVPHGPLMEKFDDKNGGGGALSDAEFQTKVLGAQEETQKSLTAVETFAKEQNTKHMSEIEDIKKKSGIDAEDRKVLSLAIQKLQLNKAATVRRSYADGIDRMMADPEKKTLLNGLIRKAMKAPLSEAHEKALTSASTPGSTFISDELFTDVYDTLSSYGIWSSFDVRNVNKKTNKFLVKTARPIAKVFGEGITITDDTAKAGTSVTQTAKRDDRHLCWRHRSYRSHWKRHRRNARPEGRHRHIARR